MSKLIKSSSLGVAIQHALRVHGVVRRCLLRRGVWHLWLD